MKAHLPASGGAFLRSAFVRKIQQLRSLCRYVSNMSQNGTLAILAQVPERQVLLIKNKLTCSVLACVHVVF